MIWSECKEIWSDGPREYVMHLWNVLDFGMLSIFVASFTARFMAFLKASKAQLYIDLHVPNHDISNASLPADIAYFTYGEGTTLHKRFKLSVEWILWCNYKIYRFSGELRVDTNCLTEAVLQ